MVEQYSDWLNQGTFYQRTSGQKIFCRRFEGEGEDILFLHGFPTSSFDWSAVCKNLSGQARLITFDFLGFGASDKPVDHQYNYQEQCDIAVEVAQHFKIESCILVAHDYGVTAAQELLRRQTANSLNFKIRKVIFLNGGLYHKLHRPTIVQKILLTPVLGGIAAKSMTFSKFHKGMSEVFTGKYKLGENEAGQLWQGIVMNNGNKLADKLIHYVRERKANGSTWENALETSAVPKTFIWGLLDPVSGKHVIDFVKTRLKDIETLELADVAHYPQIEAPQAVSQEILKVLLGVALIACILMNPMFHAAVAAAPDTAKLDGCWDRMKADEKIGQAFTRSNKFKEAIPHLRRALAAEPNSVPVLQSLTTCLQGAGEYPEFLRLSQRILDLYPCTGGTLMQRVEVFNKLHEYDKANATAELLKKYGFTADCLRVLFAPRAPSGASDKSVEQIKAQLALTPTCPDLYLKLASIYQQTAEHVEALEVTQRGMKITPVHSWPWRLLASIRAASLLALGKKGPALEGYSTALEGLQFGGKERPKTAAHVLTHILIGKAQLYSDLHNQKEVIGCLTLLINNEAPSPDHYVQRAHAYAEANDYTNAIKDCDFALLIAHDFTIALEARSTFLTKVKRYKDSAKDLTVLLSRATDQTYYLQRATDYELDNQLDKALADYTTILAMDPKEVMALEQRARVYRKMGKNDLAAKDELAAKSIHQTDR